MRFPGHRPASGSAALVLLLASGFAAAQSEPPQGSRAEPFVEVLDVELVNVDVYVTDSKGNPVHGLTLADFEVFQDGRPVTVTNFHTVEGRRVRAAPAAAADRPATAPQEPTTGPAAPLASAAPGQGIHIVLYFDNLYLRPFNRNKVMREVRAFLLDHVTPEDRVMVISSERAIHVRQPFTSDLGAVSDALAGMEKLSGFAVQGASSRRDVIRAIDRARDRAEAVSHVEFFAKSAHHDVTTSLDALKDIVGSLAGLPGRKALIHVSDGMPLVAGEDLFKLVDSTFPEGPYSSRLLANLYSARRQFRELTARANASRVTFYTISAAGLRSHDSLSAEYGGLGGNLRDRASVIEADFTRLLNETESLQMMAYETGGTATLNTNNFDDALARIGADFASYYSLGYPAPSPGDGRLHKIEVRVARPDVEVRHRTGYRGRTPERLVYDSTYASLLFGVESNPLGVEVEFESQSRRDDGNYLLSVLVKVPIGNVVLIPRQELNQGNMRVAVGAIDEQGRVSAVDQAEVPIRIPDADLPAALRQYYVYAAQLLMRGGLQTVAVGVRDEFSGQSSYVRRAVRVGA